MIFKAKAQTMNFRLRNVGYLTLVIFICYLSVFMVDAWAAGSDYGIREPEKVKMSYRYVGGYSPYSYIQVDINEGKAKCSFQYIGQGESEHSSAVKLPLSFVSEMISRFKTLNFYNLNIAAITLSDPNIKDAGTTTISFEYAGNEHKIQYRAIKTKCINHACFPSSIAAARLTYLQGMFNKIFSQEEYLFQLRDYQKKDLGVLANLLSSIGADARNKRILNPDIFIPIMMEIISDQGLRESVGQYVLSALEDIVGKAAPPGSEWDYEKWFKWWEINKTKYEKN